MRQPISRIQPGSAYFTRARGAIARPALLEELVTRTYTFDEINAICHS
ncbi:hypothetical protein [Nocardia vaccinii]|nr:hypothetical protein [Nocardia vaccinii]